MFQSLVSLSFFLFFLSLSLSLSLSLYLSLSLSFSIAFFFPLSISLFLLFSIFLYLYLSLFLLLSLCLFRSFFLLTFFLSVRLSRCSSVICTYLRVYLSVPSLCLSPYLKLNRPCNILYSLFLLFIFSVPGGILYMLFNSLYFFFCIKTCFELPNPSSFCLDFCLILSFIFYTSLKSRTNQNFCKFEHIKHST